MPSIKYVPAFDGLRCIAVLFVLLIHGHTGYFKGGWIGVDIFFVLSGYLITNLLQTEYNNTGRISFKRFYIRRILRLFPALIIGILLANILWPYTLHASQNPNRFLATFAGLFYFANFLSADVMGSLGPLWSLSVEEHFYFIWPILMTAFLLAASRKIRVIFLTFSLIVISMIKIYTFHRIYPIQYGLFIIDNYRSTFCRIDSIMLGAGLALVVPTLKPATGKPIYSHFIFLIICTLLAAILFSIDITTSLFSINVDTIYWWSGGFVQTNVLCLSVVIFALKFPDYPLLSNSITRWIGRRSYGVYLYHLPIFLVFDTFLQGNNIPNTLLINAIRFAITFLIAGLSFRFIEQPILQYGKRAVVSYRPA